LLFSKKDVCPYLGGAFGFHWVNHEHIYDYGSSKSKKGDGFEIAANGGVKLFHTFDFQVMANLAYSYTFNNYDDEALIFTVGLLK